MHFEEGHLYHIYNQGNNRQKIFFNRENYLFFLKKIKTHLLPHCDIIAYCLMPNHFHIMVFTHHTHQMTPSHLMSMSINPRPLTSSIAIMLRSYTRAIHKQEQITGSLFRQKTKAVCLTCNNGITPSFYNSQSGTTLNTDNPELQYPYVCFNYIHNNPVEAKLVKHAIDWEFSSARDYEGLRQNDLINKNKAKDYFP